MPRSLPVFARLSEAFFAGLLSPALLRQQRSARWSLIRPATAAKQTCPMRGRRRCLVSEWSAHGRQDSSRLAVLYAQPQCLLQWRRALLAALAVIREQMS